MNSVTTDVTHLAQNYGLIQLTDEKSTSQQTLLLVDDEENILKSLQRLFYGSGFLVITANSGEQALKKLAEYEPEIIISDVHMPGMDGVDLLCRIAKSHPDTERILLTGYSDMESTITAINSGGISRYIQKPWNDVALLSSIEQSFSQLDLKRHTKQLQVTTQYHNEKLKLFNQNLERTIESKTNELVKTNQLLTLHSEEIEHSHHDFIELFMPLMMSNLGTFYQDYHQASQLALDIGNSLGLNLKDLQALHYAAKLRHIGMLRLEDEITSLSYDQLTKDQQKQLNQYPFFSYEILHTQPALSQASEIVLAHKERLDGMGYPKHLCADKISLTAKILAVVNDYLALINGAITTESKSTEEALEYIIARIHTHYAEEVVAALIYLLENDD
jgi:response regulator RpfG family c-di-GMP phosphodiesterase